MIQNTPHHSWHRLIARFIDTIILGGIVNLLALSFVFLYSPKLYLEVSNFLDATSPLLCITFCLGTFILEPFFLRLFGFTPGKFLFNIRVTSLLEKKPSLKKAYRRSFLVLIYGLGLGIPPVFLFTLFFSYRQLKNKGSCLYDTKSSTEVHHNKIGFVRISLIVLLVAFLIALNAKLIFLSLRTADWKVYTTTDYRFTSILPLPPEITTKNLERGDLKVTITSYNAFLNMFEGAYIRVRDYSKKITNDKFEQLANILLSNLLEGKDYELLEKNKTTHKEFPALDFKIKDNKSSVIWKGRYIRGGENTMYLVLASYLKETNKHQEFIETFEILE